jgi:hypothetical protein
MLYHITTPRLLDGIKCIDTASLTFSSHLKIPESKEVELQPNNRIGFLWLDYHVYLSWLANLVEKQ